jgi:hypothetical protein
MAKAKIVPPVKRTFLGPNLSTKAPAKGAVVPYTSKLMEKIPAVLALLHPNSSKIAT